jgi:hypothetical protein
MPNGPPFCDVSVYIEQEEQNRFKIQSDQLEQIGAQLRGPRHFSIFHSIILPLVVTVATLLFTSLFQYVSWYNSVSLQDATDVASNAERAYEKAAAAIGTRRYAVFVFLPSLRDLVKAKTRVEAAARARVEAAARASDEAAVTAIDQNRRRDSESSAHPGKTDTKLEYRKPSEAYATTIVPPEGINDGEAPLHKYVMDVHKQRFASYYRELKLWNENYDHLLTEIDYSLDKPVFRQAGRQSERVSYAKFSQINCSISLADELARLHLNPSSLKLRFAGINKCFMDVSRALDRQLTMAIQATEPDFDEASETRIRADLDSLLSKANAFRCYALRRIDYYKAQKGLSILSISDPWRWLTNAAEKEAKRHLEDPAKSCDE